MGLESGIRVREKTIPDPDPGVKEALADPQHWLLETFSECEAKFKEASKKKLRKCVKCHKMLYQNSV
jgi:hypothetical protein